MSLKLKFLLNKYSNYKLLKSAKTIIPTVIFLIYVVIAFTFRSYSQPLLLILMIPFCIVAVAWGHESEEKCSCFCQGS